MVTKFKIFENNKNDLEQYVGTFILNSKNLEENIEEGICLCTSMHYNDDGDIFAQFDYFEFKDNDLLDFYGNNEIITTIMFDSWKNEFMTPSDFFNTYPELCEKFYNAICSKLKEEDLYYWRERMLKNCKQVLETISELQHYVDAEKYNL